MENVGIDGMKKRKILKSCERLINKNRVGLVS